MLMTFSGTTNYVFRVPALKGMTNLREWQNRLFQERLIIVFSGVVCFFEPLKIKTL